MKVIWTIVFGFLPAPLQVLILGIVAVMLVLLVFRLIALVLDAIPFL